jgi:hypothetical protein
MKCVSAKSDVQFDTPVDQKQSAIKNAMNDATAANAALIQNITYFKDYFDSQ